MGMTCPVVFCEVPFPQKKSSVVGRGDGSAVKCLSHKYGTLSSDPQHSQGEPKNQEVGRHRQDRGCGQLAKPNQRPPGSKRDCVSKNKSENN